MRVLVALAVLYAAHAARSAEADRRQRAVAEARARHGAKKTHETAVELGRALVAYGHVRPSSGPNEFWDEAEELLRGAAARGPREDRVDLLIDAADVARLNGETTESLALLDEADAALRGSGDEARAAKLWEAFGDARAAAGDEGGAAPC